MNPTHLALAMLGGALGAGLRYWLGASLLQKFGDGLPWGTLAANLGGSFLAGLLFAVLAGRGSLGDALRALLIVGLMGGLTTYSALMLELMAFHRGGHPERALGYLALTLAAGLALVWLGLRLGEALRGPMPSSLG
ncbi:CrcB family protein [Silanimonas sp.]|jgi:CrcB protein|uniref:fluoride efflux transporter FluC n=1 Tax=Silanimonas sp. TaxID=1929290 RepID=UPI0022C5BADC|nr:CrcB family protein [Silanimonas sp.]MCZ8167343.1 CrcB family protein [Silanimonas sp.]